MTEIDTMTSMQPRVDKGLRRLRDAVGETIGSVFYGTLLSTMRDSSLKGKYGHGGRGEEVFAAQMDGILAAEMGKATRGGLGDALYDTLKRQQMLIDKSARSNGEPN